MPIYHVIEPGLGRQRVQAWRHRAWRMLGLLVLALLGCATGLAILDQSGGPVPSRFLDGLWNAANLVTTLGDFSDFSLRQKAFMLATMLITFVLGGYALGELTGLLSNEAVLVHRENRTMEHILKGLSNHVVVIGFRSVGELVAGRLHAAGETLVVVERDPAMADRASRLGHLVVLGDAGVDDHVFERARLDTARSVVVTTDDADRNVAITLMAHALNPQLRIAVTGQNSARGALLKRAGASEVVVADELIAGALIDRLGGGTKA